MFFFLIEFGSKNTKKIIERLIISEKRRPLEDRLVGLSYQGNRIVVYRCGCHNASTNSATM